MPPSLPFQGVPRDYTRAKFLFPQPLLSGLIAVLVFSILERLLFTDIRAQSLVKSFNLLFNPLFVEKRQQNKNFCPPRIRGSCARIKEPLPLRRSKYICFGCNLFWIVPSALIGSKQLDYGYRVIKNGWNKNIGWIWRFLSATSLSVCSPVPSIFSIIFVSEL